MGRDRKERKLKKNERKKDSDRDRVAIWLFGGKIEPKILETRACDLALWRKT